MSSLHDDDQNLHHCDNSHRWIAPPGVDQDVWEAKIRDHMAQHRVTMGGPARRNGGEGGARAVPACIRNRRSIGPAVRVRNPRDVH